MMVQVLAPWNRDTKKVFLYPPPKLINLNSGASCNDGRVGEMHQSGLLSIRRLYFWGLTWTLILWLPFLCLPLFLDLTSISETSSRAFAPRGGGALWNFFVMEKWDWMQWWGWNLWGMEGKRWTSGNWWVGRGKRLTPSFVWGYKGWVYSMMQVCILCVGVLDPSLCWCAQEALCICNGGQSVFWLLLYKEPFITSSRLFFFSQLCYFCFLLNYSGVLTLFKVLWVLLSPKCCERNIV